MFVRDVRPSRTPVSDLACVETAKRVVLDCGGIILA